MISALAAALFGSSAVYTSADIEESQAIIDVGGDVLPESTWQDPANLDDLFAGMRREFQRSDLVFVNFEEPITSSNLVTPYKNPAAVRAGLDYVLKATNPRIPEVLRASGIGLVGLANNHMMDYSEAGLSDTLSAFNSGGLPTVGAGFQADAERAYIFEKDGIRIALLAFTDIVPTNFAATPNTLGVASSQDDARLARAIKRARRQADFVVLMIHWGAQGDHRIIHRQQELARVAAEAGCDVVVGMHPHVLQGIEYMGDVPVFYSVGNLAFPSSSPAGEECIVVRLRFRPKHLPEVELVPGEISWRGAPAVAKRGEAAAIDAHLDQYCRGFDTAIQGGKLVRHAPREPLVFDEEERTKPHGRS